MPYPATIVVQNTGWLANRMFQHMFAHELAYRVGKPVTICGESLPEWGIELPEPMLPPKGSAPDAHVLRLLNFNVDALASAMRQGIVGPVILDGWPMRVEYYRAPEHYAQLFRPDEAPSYQASDDEVLLHVRAGDTIDGHHPLYFPLPPAYYAKVIEETGLRPVFIGELEDNRYVEILRSSFPEAAFLPPADAVADFQSLRNARHVALSISTFSWLATWLSSQAQTIHLPVCGMFYPHQMGPNLLPVSDLRYRFYEVPFPDMNEREATGMDALLEREVQVGTIERSDLFDMARKALLEPSPQ